MSDWSPRTSTWLSWKASFLAELRDSFNEEAGRLGRQAFLIAESDLNDVRVIQLHAQGGHALDAQWHDEFHHTVVSMLTGAKCGYLADFGRPEQVQKAITNGFVYDGVYSAYRQRHFGSSSRNQPGQQFVAFIQNHDQVANAAQGFRLSQVVSQEQYKLAVMLLLCSPFLPLLFMGEEFADTSPFLYFTSHSDRALARAVTEARRKEFAAFASSSKFADPQAVETFEKSKIAWALIERSRHKEVLRLYQDLMALRKHWPCLRNGRKDLTSVKIDERAEWLQMERKDPSGCSALLLCNFSRTSVEFPVDSARWRLAAWTRSAPVESTRGRFVLDGRSATLYIDDGGKSGSTPVFQ